MSTEPPASILSGGTQEAFRWFLDSMDAVHRAVRGAHDREPMMRGVLDVVVEIFRCDRAWLLFPCDPAAVSWTVAMQRDGAHAAAHGCSNPLPATIDAADDLGVRALCEIVQASSEPIAFGPAAARPLPPAMAQRVGVQSQLAMGVQTKVEQPYVFVLHQCSSPRIWTADEQRLFQEIGRRLADALDVSERKRAERAVIESHSLLRAVVEGTSDAVFVKDLQGRYLMINTAGARFLGRTVDEVIGQHDRDLFTAEAAAKVVDHDSRVLEGGGLQMFEETITAAGVTRTYLATKGVYRDAQGKVVGLIGVSRDITEMKRLEEQFQQAQKMEAVGRLAGGIAHDFNNLLTVINGYGELIFNRLPADDPNREPLAEVLRSGERATNLTRQLLAFSRKQVLQPQVVSLNALLGELRKLLRPLIGEDVELSFVPDRDLGLVKVDPAQFEQAIINLVVNARDAMPDGGRLIIETRNGAWDEAFVTSHTEVRRGRYVLVAVTDSGQGMDDATQARIFEPFFTTKGPAKGTGLGLAMVYGFVKQSGGHIEVDSELGRGTTIKIYLPRADETTPAAKSAKDMKVPHGSETVLLVEDEDAVRTLARYVLRSSGYTVLEARNGAEGLLLGERHQGALDLLLTDVVMPRMSGRELAERMAALRPDLSVLYMSGYTDDAVIRHGVLGSDTAFLQKPFTPAALVQRVRETLDLARRVPTPVA